MIPRKSNRHCIETIFSVLINQSFNFFVTFIMKYRITSILPNNCE